MQLVDSAGFGARSAFGEDQGTANSVIRSARASLCRLTGAEALMEL
jgi:hypothetical protein